MLWHIHLFIYLFCFGDRKTAAKDYSHCIAFAAIHPVPKNNTPIQYVKLSISLGFNILLKNVCVFYFMRNLESDSSIWSLYILAFVRKIQAIIC